MLESAHGGARILELRAARGALPDVRLQRRRAEAYVAVEEQIDFAGQ
jgi:hypothetical protein